MKFGDYIPPNIYNKPVLWKCKQQFMDNFLEITEKCPIKSLIELKYGKYAGSIHTISADKLFIHYWTPTQLIFFKYVQKPYCRLSIDATGNLVKKLKRSKQNILSSHIFLYERVINVPKKVHRDFHRRRRRGRSVPGYTDLQVPKDRSPGSGPPADKISGAGEKKSRLSILG